MRDGSVCQSICLVSLSICPSPCLPACLLLRLIHLSRTHVIHVRDVRLRLTFRQDFSYCYERRRLIQLAFLASAGRFACRFPSESWLYHMAQVSSAESVDTLQSVVED